MKLNRGYSYIADKAKQLPIDHSTQNITNETTSSGLRIRMEKSLWLKTRVILVERSPGAYSLSKALRLLQFSSHWHQPYS